MLCCALWAKFWLLVGFQICGKSEVRRKLNELATDGIGAPLSWSPVSTVSFRFASLLSFRSPPNAFSARLFIYMSFAILCFYFIFSLGFYFSFFLAIGRPAGLLYGFVSLVVNQRTVFDFAFGALHTNLLNCV